MSEADPVGTTAGSAHPARPPRLGIEQLDRALLLLDHELQHLALDEPLQVRAIGGYALLKHGVRTGNQAITADIDTVTTAYTDEVQQAIHTVARAMGLGVDWLNNDNLGDENPRDIEAMYDARWQPQEQGLQRIDLAIADVPTLTRAKIIAADTAEYSGRDQDIPDLLALLRHQGITTVAQFRARYPDPFDEFPAADEAVVRGLAVSRKRPRS